MAFRRDFDAEIVARARNVPQVAAPSPIPSPPPRKTAERVIIIAVSQPILGKLLSYPINIKPVGSDWHITARSEGAYESVLSFLKLNRVHGVTRTLRKEGSAA